MKNYNLTWSLLMLFFKLGKKLLDFFHTHARIPCYYIEVHTRSGFKLFMRERSYVGESLNLTERKRYFLKERAEQICKAFMEQTDLSNYERISVLKDYLLDGSNEKIFYKDYSLYPVNAGVHNMTAKH